MLCFSKIILPKVWLLILTFVIQLKTMLEKEVINFERTVLVGIVTQNQSEEKLKEYLDELEFLTFTAGGEVIKRFSQKLERPNPKTFLGTGKIDEINHYIKEHIISTVIFDDELSPSQQKNLSKILDCKILDRTNLILDIFAQRAETSYARTQVELAQCQYLLPRLSGMWTHLERQKGGIGLRGPGETEIETDRRIVRDKISLLRKRLAEIDKQAFTQRKDRGEFIRVALVGYTNVGKSTLMNLLSKRDVFAENKLFATLDTTTSKVVYENTPFLLSDTVGFIRKLPHHLVESFKSTLDEVREADILLHIVDISHPQYEEQIAVVNKTLEELGALDKPTLTIFNKMDQYEKNTFDEWLEEGTKQEILLDLYERWSRETNGNAVFVAATEKRNLDVLRLTILKKVRELYRIRYPYKTDFFYGE